MRAPWIPGLCSLFTLALPAHAAHFQPVLRLGEHAPGYPPDAVFDRLSVPTDSPYLTPGGVVVFRGHVGAPYNENAVWVGRPGDLQLVVRSSDPLIAGQFIDPPIANDAREVVFTTRGSLGARIYAWRDGVLSLLAADNGPEPGGGGVWNNPYLHALGSSGRVLCFDVDLPDATWLVSLRGAPPFNPASFNGDSVPGFTDYIWTRLGEIESANVISAGNVLGQVGVIKHVGLPFDERLSIALVSSAGAHRIVSIGDPAPGFAGLTLAGGVSFSPATNDAGHRVLQGGLAGPGVTSDNDIAYWRYDGQSITPVLRVGDPVPGPGMSCAFSGAHAIRMSAAGELAIWAHLTGPGITEYVNDVALLMGPPGNLRRVFQLGDEVSPGVRINILPALSERGSSFNRTGTFAFAAHSTSTQSTRRSVWIVEPGAAALRHVVTEFQPVSLAPLPPDTLGYIYNRIVGSGGQDGQPTFLSDAGEIAVYAYMFSGSASQGFYLLSSPCNADANGDSRVDFLDLNIVLGQYTQAGPGLPGDLNDDGVVNFLDLNLVLSEFGRHC